MPQKYVKANRIVPGLCVYGLLAISAAVAIASTLGLPQSPLGVFGKLSLFSVASFISFYIAVFFFGTATESSSFTFGRSRFVELMAMLVVTPAVPLTMSLLSFIIRFGSPTFYGTVGAVLLTGVHGFLCAECCFGLILGLQDESSEETAC